MMEIFEVIILSIIQGIGEWFPISSSGHLAIMHSIFGSNNLSFDVFLHFASIIAVIIIFHKDIIQLFNLKKKENIKYLFFILISIIPAGIIGILFKDKIEGFFSSMFYLGLFFILSGVIIFSTKFFKTKRKEMNFFDVCLIGIFQAIAIVPGVSRSGSTISAGIYMGLEKKEAIKFSFLMAIPIILGASIVEFNDLNNQNIDYSLLLISFLICLVVSLFTIKLFVKIVKSDKFYYFGIYNFIIGLIVLIISLI
jgi:undecaprenyl-diphosphatase